MFAYLLTISVQSVPLLLFFHLFFHAFNQNMNIINLKLSWRSCALPTLTAVLEPAEYHLTVILAFSIYTKVGAGRLEEFFHRK